MPGALNIESRGQGSDLVMLHGWGMNSAAWGAFADDLARDFRLHLVDLPGHGRSAPVSGSPGFKGLAESLVRQLPRSAWLGWSLGGEVALQAAALYPGRVSCLVLLGTGASFVAGQGWPEGMKVTDFESFRQRLLENADKAVSFFNSLQVTGTDAAKKTRKALSQAITDFPPDPGSLRDGLEFLAETDVSHSLASIGCRALGITGSEDRLVSPASSRAMMAGIKGSEYYEVQGAGHAPFLSHADETAEVVRRFLATEALQ